MQKRLKGERDLRKRSSTASPSPLLVGGRHQLLRSRQSRVRSLPLFVTRDRYFQSATPCRLGQERPLMPARINLAETASYRFHSRASHGLIFLPVLSVSFLCSACILFMHEFLIRKGSLPIFLWRNTGVPISLFPAPNEATDKVESQLTLLKTYSWCQHPESDPRSLHPAYLDWVDAAKYRSRMANNC